MSNDSHPLREWFGIVTAMLRREDLFLRNCLQPYSPGAYEYWPLGIAALPEPVIVYLLLRELWSINYPRALGWEHSYPDSAKEKLDLAIYHQRPDEHVHGRCPEHVIEVKIKWFGSNLADQMRVWWDLLRLLRFEQAVHRYLLLFTFGFEGASLANDVKDLVEMRFGQNPEHYSRERLIADFISPSNPFRPYYLQHFDGVSEIMSEEFETRLSHNRPGRIRVSLLEVFRRHGGSETYHSFPSSGLRQSECGQ